MAKKKQKKEIQSKHTELFEQSQSVVPIVEQGTMFDKLLKGFVPYIILFALSFLLYSNTFKHQYALDDEIVICQNEYVLQGVAGLSDIFSKDLFDSFYRQMNTTAQLSGGRYRPLSVASFAIEQEFIGTREDAKFDPNTIWDFNQNGKQDAEEDINGDGIYNDRDYKAKGFGLRHINNVIFYGIAICMLFLFLSSIVFKQNKLLAFIISLLFLAHPIHTEVVANVKSRDEIFSLFFMLSTIWLAHQYELKKGMKFLILTCVSFFCAILSKEYGATLLILLPLSLFLFGNETFTFKKYFKLFGGLLISFFMYVGIRSHYGLLVGKSDIQDSELLNNPYKLAEDSQALATKIFIFIKYLGTLIIPHPLSSDYGYNSIPYKDFSNPWVWLSIISLIAIPIIGWMAFRKKHWLAFAIAFYMGTILLVTNLIFNVGATMGERLVFHASLGFCMVMGYGVYWIATKFNKPQLALLLALPIFILYSLKTFSRNNAWKNDISLALTDVETMPESISLNGNACSRNIDLSEWPANKSNEKMYLDKAIRYGKKALKLHPDFVNGYMNIGLAYAKLDMLDSAKTVWQKAFTIYPHHPNKTVYFNLLADAYNKKAYDLAQKKQWLPGRFFLEKALEMTPENARLWYDLGGFSYQAKDYGKAKQAWTRAYQLNPKDTNIARVQGLLR